MREASLTTKRLRAVLDYEPSTGLFRWRIRLSNRVKVGDIAGSRTKYGYVEIRIDDSLYLAHRLAVKWVTGRWPKVIIDHRDVNDRSNRWGNLRQATHSQNHGNTNLQKNNTSGFRGVVWFARDKCWRAQIKINGSTIHLGYFKTAEAASAAYLAAAEKHFGEFLRAA